VATPLFTSDAEALKAATDAYAAYQRVSDEVLHDGGLHADRYADVASGSALKKALNGAKQFRDQGLHTTGVSKFDSIRLQQRTRSTVTVYVCDDVSGTDLLDSAGHSQVKPGSNRRTPWEVEIRPGPSTAPVVSKRDFWAGSNFCER
jgi:hypothetical protein